jgi:hypothetical protein
MRKQQFADADMKAVAESVTEDLKSKNQDELWINFRCREFSYNDTLRPNTGDYWNLDVNALNAEATNQRRFGCDDFAVECDRPASELEHLESNPVKA